MADSLLDRSAVVTGGGKGIGRGIAQALAREGAAILLADVDRENARSTAAEITKIGCSATVFQCDVGTREGAEAAIGAAQDAFGKIDILVNNAGVVGAPGWQDRPEPNDDDWAAVLRVNLMSRVYCAEAVSPHMKTRRYGKIINIASIGGVQGGANLAHYCASKAADINYTQSLAIQLGPYNINANAILPGMLFTDMLQGIYEQGKIRSPRHSDTSNEELYNRAVSRIPMRRGQTPEDVGELAVFLASDKAHNINGMAINVDGGFRMH